MSVIASIAAKRQILLDGLYANEGEINLQIFEDFYPDEAHFIYELLQNAEDAGATEVSFALSPRSCAFEHNGTRHFNEKDIRAITGIFNSSKKENPDKIGKFGVGFKSVFVYTNTPIAYSRDYSFKILKLILPQEVPSKPELEGRTRFEFPFNNVKKNVAAAYQEVKSGLENLSGTTLLFLNNIRHIHWKVGEIEGAVHREEHSETHVEVVKLVGNKEVASSHWLRFAGQVQDLEEFSSVQALERQKVAVAFELQLLDSAPCFDKSKALSKQMKIVPAVQGTVSVFFPAEKETSGLRFHLHAPFVPELSRASIKQSPENLPLIAQLANLTAKSLHLIRDAGLLTGEFLAVLPNDDDNLPERYSIIRQTVLEEMRQHPLVPKHGGGHAPASRLVQSRATLKALLKAEDLELVMGRDDSPDWVIGITQRNSTQDRLLGSLYIPNWDFEDLTAFLEQHARKRGVNDDWADCEVNEEVQNWIKAKSFDWLQSLYSLLYKHCEDADDYGSLSHVNFVKLTSGELGTGASARFLNGPPTPDDPFPRVDDAVFTAGSRSKLQAEARLFLERIGVREPNDLDEISHFLNASYGFESETPSDRKYSSDLKRMIAFSDKHPESHAVFANAYIFRIESAEFKWATAGQVYLDAPYRSTNLTVLYAAAIRKGGARKSPLSDWYRTCGIPLDKIAQFAEWARCETSFDELYKEVGCTNNPDWDYLRQAPGSRTGDVVNRDFALSAQCTALLTMRQQKASLLVWEALCRPGRMSPQVLRACFQRTSKGGPHYAASQLVCSLRHLSWIPQTDGAWVTPSAASASRLPEGFVYDARQKWLEAVGFGSEERKQTADNIVRAEKRAELGFQSEQELELALEFLKLPKEVQRRFLEDTKRRAEPAELPERLVRNADLRRQRVGGEAERTSGKESVIRPRSVQLGAAETKTNAKLYLVDQYTNSDGTMVCQVCKDALPFKLPNGFYYFEAVEVFPDVPKRYRETYLALCPNHAAAFVYANAQRNQMYDLVATVSGNEIEVSLGGEVTTIYFTQTHLADMQACLAMEEETE